MDIIDVHMAKFIINIEIDILVMEIRIKTIKI